LVNYVTDVTLLYPSGRRKKDTLLMSGVIAENSDNVFEHVALVELGYEPYMPLSTKVLRHIEKVQKYIGTENLIFDENQNTLFKIGQKIVFNV